MKLVKTVTERQYELTYLLAGDLLDADVAKVKKEISDLIEKNAGAINQEENWGRKTLAYKITANGKTYQEAVYVHCLLTLPATEIQKIDRELILNRYLIRHLLVLASNSVLEDKLNSVEEDKTA